MRSVDLRELARGKPCFVRLVGVCNFNAETTILAHLRRANVAGVGQKPPDTCAVFACSSCHDVIDARTRSETVDDIAADLLDALVRQHAWYERHGIVLREIE